MKHSTIAVVLLCIAVAGLTVALIVRPVPHTTSYRSQQTAGQTGGSAYGGASKRVQAESAYPDCTFDGNYANDKPGACPTKK
jgi:hypothetical protein